MHLLVNESTNLNLYINRKVHNVCPHCLHVINPTVLILNQEEIITNQKRTVPSLQGNEVKEEYVQLLDGYLVDMILKCNNYDCERLFIAHYQTKVAGINNGITSTMLIGLSPKPRPELGFDKSLKMITNDFYKIYEEALIAETNGLTQICGMGYRKALEFLIKDFVLYTKNIQDPNSFLEKDMGKVLSEDVENAKITAMARRASWLGNDQAHYKRKWIEKDVQDLKALIKVIINEIENEMIFRTAMEDMPKGK